MNHYNISINKNINFKIYDEAQPFPKKFWYLCLNNPRYAYGENDLPDKKECYLFHENENFQLAKTIRLQDYLLYLVKKK